ncbi:hypothetical protein CGGC5_v011129 [Colletotrichum fructicola Nara gc5]|uniref:Uncharacterized protein n=1 Tax=Colletotrichum fructicola (strain Nara gc5) TaxID=1213859 RepID=A0A7J6IUA3_COLFN|nr:hypothetical protein CGGC5_v011129 [Colletotrichum fructicola Nara gc5]KAF5488337.1 hypothetical protein CGCF413_v012667 [Colletotrichum fructicola]
MTTWGFGKTASQPGYQCLAKDVGRRNENEAMGALAHEIIGRMAWRALIVGFITKGRPELLEVSAAVSADGDGSMVSYWQRRR